MAITIQQICDAVATTLGTASLVSVVQSVDDLTEGVPDTRTLQVYWDEIAQDAQWGGRGTERTTFQAGVRQTDVLILADYFAKRRSDLAEDLKAVTAGVESIQSVLETQNVKPLFGLAGIQAFTWRCKRQAFVVDDPNQPYVGARFTITVRVF